MTPGRSARFVPRSHRPRRLQQFPRPEPVMLALYCPDRRFLERMRTALPVDEEVRVATDWRSLETAAPTTEGSVIMLGWLGDEVAWHRLSTFRMNHPLHPIILVTPRDADNVRHLRALRMEEVVSPSEMDRSLWPAVGRARTCGKLRRIALALDSAPFLSPPLRTALALACRAAPPVRTVKHLAHAAGCDRRTLWRHWRRTPDAAREIRLEDVLHWLLLLHAVGYKTSGHAWSRVAAEVNVHEHTLGRMAHQLTRRTLGDLALGGQPAVLAAFTVQVLSPLLGDGVRELSGGAESPRHPPPACG